MGAFGAFDAQDRERRQLRANHVTQGFALRRALLRASVIVGLLFSATAAHAVNFIPFDAEPAADGFSYGFVMPGSYGITSFKRMDAYYTAARSTDTANAPSALLHVDPVSFERCPRSSDDCSSTHHIFDVEWDVTFNGSVLDGGTEGKHLVDVILVDSDPNPIFDDLLVEVDFDQVAELDGESLSLEVADYRDGDFYFLAAALGQMMDGETKRLAFSYKIEGELPLASGGQVGFLFPTILPAAYIPIPEPGTGMMLGLGLVALAKRGRRNR